MPMSFSILPGDIDVAGAAARGCVAVIATILPLHTAVGSDDDKFELHAPAGGNAGHNEPVGIVGIVQRTYGRGGSGTPVTQLVELPAQIDIIARTGGGRVVNGEGDGHLSRAGD